MYKHLIKGKKCILFDLDGTIINNRSQWMQVLDQTLTEAKLVVPQIDFTLSYGVPLDEIWDKIVVGYNIPKPKEATKNLVAATRANYLAKIQKEGVKTISGFWGIFREFKEKKFMVALVTGSAKEEAAKVLELADMKGIFDFEITGDMVKKNKPHPDIYNLAHKTSKHKKAEILVFEDSLAGVTSAVDAGLDTIVVYDNVVPDYDYPKEVKQFIPDFVPITGNLDLDYMEQLKKNLAAKML